METGKGSQNLEQEVLKAGLCTSCGACVDLCPYIKVINDRVAIIEPCGLNEGKCYDFCPRTPTKIGALRRSLFGSTRAYSPIGPYISIEMAQAKDIKVRRRAQYGGVVSALMTYAIDMEEIDAAVLTKPFNGNLMPKSTVAERSSQVLQCAGTNYVPGTTLGELNRLLKKHKEDIGIVGLPCQILALRKMQISEHEIGAERVKLAIGLFCTWALSYKGFYELLSKNVDPLSIKHIDIPPPPANIMVVDTDSSKVKIPLQEVRKFIKPTCSICFDMTSEFADISVGVVEGEEEWNTLIVRTTEGEKLVQKAKRSKVIETKPLKKANFDHLKEASQLKKKRAIEEIVKRTGDEKNLMYLYLSAAERKMFL